MTLVRAVIFDLDGVLCRTDMLHAAAWRAVADREGIPLAPDLADRVRGVPRERSLEVVLELAPRTYSPAERAELAAAKDAIFRASLERLTPDDLLEGADRLLMECAGHGIRTAVASSSRNACPILDRLGITGRFAAIVDGHADCRPKPAPDPFLLAASKLGAPPAACVVIEDAAVGVVGARAAGMRVVGVGPPSTVRGADLIVPDLAGLPMSALLGLGQFAPRTGPSVLQRTAASHR